MARRALVVVLDGCGAGELPDAAEYGDEGASTLLHVADAVGGLDVPVLERLGLGSILPLAGVAPASAPVLHGRLHALGAGKDSTAGHWELMGVVTAEPPRTYPAGFPAEVVEHLEALSGRGVVCNEPCDGLAAIERFGAAALRDGSLIVYTSQDSVLQIAAHADVVPEHELYEICTATRAFMRAEHAVGRVIARPFRGAPGAFERTAGRRDFALTPPHHSYLDELRDAGVAVHSVGKVAELFARVGIDHEHPGATNAQAIDTATRLLEAIDGGLVFANLVETDQIYGHRKDADGFHDALREIDAAVGRWLALLGDDDLLVLTADHGCDPATPGSDHTREHVPLLARFPGHGGRRHDGPLADVGASALWWLAGRDARELEGAPFAGLGAGPA